MQNEKETSILRSCSSKRQAVPVTTRHATSVEVARLAGVHQTTVSRVLNKPHLVNEETRRRVQQAIEALHYRPWSQGRSLVMQCHETIGLVTDLSEKLSFHHVALVEGIVESLVEARYGFTMATVSRKATVEQLLELPLLRQRRCDGVIFNLESVGQEILEISSRLDIPCVWVNPAFHAPVDCVAPDDQEIAEKAVNYLISRGHRQIAYLNCAGTSHRSSIEQRQRGYEMAMLRSRLEPMPLFDQLIDNKGKEGHLLEEFILEKIRERLFFWLSSPMPPTAILTYTSGQAVRVGRIAYQENWRIPNVFSLIACDDDISLEDWPVPITAVKTNRRLCGQRGVAMLLEKIRTGASVPSLRISGELVERESVRTV